MSNLRGFNKEKDERRDEEREWRVDAVTEETFKEIFKSVVPQSHEDVEVEALSEEQFEDEIAEDEVDVSFPPFSQAIEPLPSFDTDLLHHSIRKALKMMSLSHPTLIQKHSIDIISIAKTGSGKTLAFMIPCIAKTLQLKSQLTEGPSPFLYFGGPLALIMAPTRELAIQIYNAAACLALCSGLKMSLVYGGATKESQLGPLSSGVDILIATPGRLADFVNEGLVNLAQVSFFVLDEADRMLDMGFLPQVRRIAMFLSPGRQTVLLSATWPVEVEALSRDICSECPARIKIGHARLAINEAISQVVIQVTDTDKRKQLIDLVKEIDDSKAKIIVFVRTKKSSDRLAKFLDYEGYHADSIHGDKLQDSIIEQFRNSKKNILVATDVASRGLDIKDIKYVINYDFPQSIEDYIHRIGRTGRAGAKGKSYTFFNDADAACASDLMEVLSKCKQKVPDFLQNLSRFGDLKKKRKSKYSAPTERLQKDSFSDEEKPQPGFPNVNPMMAMMMFNNMKMMMSQNMHQMANRAQGMYAAQMKPPQSSGTGSQVVDVDDPEPANLLSQAQSFNSPHMMNPMLQRMVQNASMFSSAHMQKSMKMMGSFPQTFPNMQPFGAKEEPLPQGNPSLHIKPKEVRVPSKDLSPDSKELIYVDSPTENTSASTSLSTFAGEARAQDRDKTVASIPAYSDFKPFAAEEVFAVQQLAFNKLP